LSWGVINFTTADVRTSARARAVVRDLFELQTGINLSGCHRAVPVTSACCRS